MWVSVRIQSSKSILFSVDKKETVGSLKAMIKDKGGISSSQETILYGNRQKLEDLKTLGECGIVKQNRLYLKLLVPAEQCSAESTRTVTADLKLTDTPERVSLIVKTSDTVEELKYLIYEKENIFPDQLEIVCKKVPLVTDCRTLSSYDIEGHGITVRKLLTSVKVKTLSGKDIEVEVSPSDSICNFKTKIHDIEGISPDEQGLIYAGKELTDFMTVRREVPQGSTVHLILRLREKTFKFITIVSIWDSLSLGIDQYMSIFSLKQLISRKIGILMESQLLLWEGRVLENNKRVFECNIPDDSVLQLVEQPVKNYRVYVSEREVNDFEVSSTSPVLILNETYGKDLIFDGKKLEPDRCLGDYNIQRGQIVHTKTPYMNTSIQIHILSATTHKKLASFYVDNFDTVLSLKVTMWSDVPDMPPPSQQRLTHNDSPMEDCQMLDEFGLKESDLIELSIPEQVFVRRSDGTAINIGVHTTDRVAVLKRLIYKRIEIKPDKQQLYYNGRVMDDESAIKSYNIGTDSMLQLCKLYCTVPLNIGHFGTSTNLKH